LHEINLVNTIFYGLHFLHFSAFKIVGQICEFVKGLDKSILIKKTKP
jgi:hypothetical protein